MPFVDTPLTAAMRRAVQDAWGRPVDGEPVRLYGGEESAAYRAGDIVVRVGPASRTNAEAEWCHGIAAHAAAGLPEAVAPLRARDGTTVVRVEGRPVSVWSHVAGEWPDADEHGDAPDERRRFIADYHDAGGTAGEMDDETVVQLIRHRLRREAAYFEHARRRGAVHDEDDLGYHERRVKTFFALRP
ncbi:hypothetical protein ACFYTC_20555 [Actinomadura nitritigenes]|uniref:hypothetical protein n=1 Tax=Actinomadura nitritigenes TaxID=134602 RepID=UPI0036BED5BF